MPASFSAQAKPLLDERLGRAPAKSAMPAKPVAASRAEAIALARRIEGWVLAVDAGLLPRALRMAPDLACGVRLSTVVGRGYGGNQPERAHAALVRRMIEALGETPQASAAPGDVDALWSLGWIEAVATLLVDRAAGGAGAPAAIEALRSAGVPEDALGYLQDQAAHGAADRDTLIALLDDYATDDRARAAALGALRAALDRVPLTPR